MRPLFFIILSLIGFGVLDLTYGQVKPDSKDDVIRVDTQLIDVPIAVNAANGMPVRGLKAANFVVYEDGKRQETVDFSAAAAPFEVALLLDTSGSTRNDLQLIQRSARQFIAGLRQGDRVSIIAFNTELNYDFFRVFDGPSTSSPLLFSRSGAVSPPPPPVTATQPVLTVTFLSDVSVFYSGVSAVVSFIWASDSTSIPSSPAIALPVPPGKRANGTSVPRRPSATSITVPSPP